MVNAATTVDDGAYGARRHDEGAIVAVTTNGNTTSLSICEVTLKTWARKAAVATTIEAIGLVLAVSTYCHMSGLLVVVGGCDGDAGVKRDKHFGGILAWCMLVESEGALALNGCANGKLDAIVRTDRGMTWSCGKVVVGTLDLLLGVAVVLRIDVSDDVGVFNAAIVGELIVFFLAVDRWVIGGEGDSRDRMRFGFYLVMWNVRLFFRVIIGVGGIVRDHVGMAA